MRKRKCESCQYEHNHASNEQCQRCKIELLAPIAKAIAKDDVDEGGEA